MSSSSLALATLAGTFASFAFGGLVFWLVPALIDEAHKHAGLFRPREEMKSVMPIGMASTFVSILIVTVIFAMTHETGSRALAGARLGALIGVLAVCNVMHNYANLRLGSKLAFGQAVTYFVQWTIVGVVIGLVYKPIAG